jgi:hypothetical protein
MEAIPENIRKAAGLLGVRVAVLPPFPVDREILEPLEDPMDSAAIRRDRFNQQVTDLLAQTIPRDQKILFLDTGHFLGQQQVARSMCYLETFVNERLRGHGFFGPVIRWYEGKPALLPDRATLEPFLTVAGAIKRLGWSDDRGWEKDFLGAVEMKILGLPIAVTAFEKGLDPAQRQGIDAAVRGGALDTKLEAPAVAGAITAAATEKGIALLEAFQLVFNLLPHPVVREAAGSHGISVN